MLCYMDINDDDDAADAALHDFTRIYILLRFAIS